MNARGIWAATVAVSIVAAAPCLAQSGAAPADTTAAPAVQAPTAPPTPPDFPRGRISGYVFGDAFYNLSGDPTHVYNAAGADLGQQSIDAIKPITKDLDGILIRRVYFQLDNDLSIKYATRFRLELDGKTLTSDGKIGTYLKNAYLQAKSVVPSGDFFFGMINTPTWENSEEFWQYRSIEKTIADFRGLASSSDLGMGLKGFADPDQHLGYSAMVGTGTGQRPETDRWKRWYLAIPIKIGDLRVEPYADYENVRVNLNTTAPAEVDSTALNNDRPTWKIFAGYEFRRFALGLEALSRVNHKSGVPNQEPRGYSLFARGTLTPTVGAFARVDQWEPNHRLDNRVDSRLWIAGLDWQPYKDVHVMPNVEATEYIAKGTAVSPSHHDLQARVTFYYRYSKPQS
ncbi:MAG: hypothetical protein E6K80_12520 [Candidatus Eisenbacteria bacterium]|uniref:Porin n=1 Tax=Eiseniibacteriota bacterium TaxID=2212470 RepID=A0A538U013_UNCEI|nr:MAG: hypothetical protein E6K80_12520 [Candidatus Eisenbacteria bacterium]